MTPNPSLFETKCIQRDFSLKSPSSALKKLSVLIPVFNEEGTIREVIAKVQAVQALSLEKEIVVVDDCSRDATREILKTIPGIRCVFHDENLGKGGAIKTGITHSSGDVLLIQDADLEYNPEDYPALLKPILDEEADLVMGSRFLFKWPKFFTRDGQPFFSHFIGNLVITFLTNLLYGQNNRDYEGCYKVITKSLAVSIPVHTNGFAYDNELICKVLRRGNKIKEIPIRYASRSYSEGKKIRWRDGVKMVWTIVKWRVLPF